MNMRDRFVLRKRFKVEGVGAAIPEDGFAAINEWMYHQYNYKLPPTFDYRWVTDKGTFPKRASKYMHDEWGIELTPYDKEKIGNFARQYSFKRDKYEFEFTDKLNWERGEFGDSGSCFWGVKVFGRYMMIHNGTLAVKFYEDGGGFGRAWIVFSPKHPNLIFVMNTYPKSFGLDQVALVLARHLDMEYKPVYLTQDGSWEGDLWINQGRAIVMYERKAEVPPDKIDLKLENTVKCHFCDKRMDETFGIFVDSESRLLCSKCKDERYFKCDDCHTDKEGQGNKVQGYRLCDKCIKEHCTTCPSCLNVVLNDNLVSTSKGKMCKECKGKIWFSCMYCYRDTLYENGQQMYGDWWCNKCVKSQFEPCGVCGQIARKGTLLTGQEGLKICRKCKVDYSQCRSCYKLYKKGGRCECRPKGEEELPGIDAPLYKQFLDGNIFTYSTGNETTWKITVDGTGIELFQGDRP